MCQAEEEIWQDSLDQYDEHELPENGQNPNYENEAEHNQDTERENKQGTSKEEKNTQNSDDNSGHEDKNENDTEGDNEQNIPKKDHNMENNNKQREFKGNGKAQHRRKSYMGEIESILCHRDRRNRGRGLEFKVKWAGIKIPPTWELAQTMIDHFPRRTAQYLKTLSDRSIGNIVKKYDKIVEILKNH